jgi:ferredoxin
MLIHGLTREHNPLRRFLLFFFARFIEVPLLKISFHLLRGRFSFIGRIGVVRALAGVLLARPFGYLGDSARPVPFPEILGFIDSLQGPIGVGPCRCRMGHRSCPHPLETDIVIRTGYEAWMRAFPRDYRQITREEAKEIVRQTHELGMFHMVFIHCPVSLYNEYVICNCCTCGCVPYIINRDLTQMNYPLIDGFFLARTDRGACKACGACVEACPFSARTLSEGKSGTSGNCFGCGLCLHACPEHAITLEQLRDPILPRDGHGNPPGHHHPELYRQHAPYRED